MQDKNLQKNIQRARRRKRIRAKISGTGTVPRISVFKSNKYIYAQLVDDIKGVTLAEASSQGAKGKTMRDRAKEAGKNLAAKALSKKISKAVFDRGGFLYRGSIKSLADGAREGGLKF